MKVKTPYFGNFSIPHSCVMCGKPPGLGMNWKISGSKSNWNGKRTTTLSLEFPLCPECYTVSRDKGFAKFLTAMGALVAFGICLFLPLFLRSSDPIEKIGLGVSVSVIWVVLYRWLSNTINEKGFTPEQRERRKRVERCAEISSFKAPSRSDKNGSVVFKFENPGFALLFSTMNSGDLSALPDRR